MSDEIAALLREAITLAREHQHPIEKLEAWTAWAEAAEDALEAHETQPKETI